MKIEFNNKWYRETCVEGGLNPDNILSSSEIELARECSIGMKKYLIAKENYQGTELQRKFDIEIKRLNEKRIGHMFQALEFAEMMKKSGEGYDKFLESHYQRNKRLIGG